MTTLPPDTEAAGAPFSVMCIEDNTLLMDALERRLGMEPGFQAMHRVIDFARAADHAAHLRPSIILLDVDLPGGVDVMVILGELVQRTPASRVVIFTGYPSGPLATRAMARGAWGFISKGVRSDRLIHAMHQVLAGEAVIEMEA